MLGQVERGYAGGSLFWQNGALRADLSRVRAYARLLAACGINAVAVNNVNVGAAETRLLTDRVPTMMALGALIGAISGVVGLFASYPLDLAPGATIVMAATLLFFLAVLFSPRQGWC